jgi:hypothetical protein
MAQKNATKKKTESAARRRTKASGGQGRTTTSARRPKEARVDGRPRAKSTRKKTIGFDFARSLINVLGEEHYPHAEFLYHELAANAFDEDATEVQIIEEVVEPATRGKPAVMNITVTDNGNGMDLDGLQHYFRVGDSEKLERKVTERFGRPLIGRIGVGKVAILKVARRWRIETERHLGLDEPVRIGVTVNIDDWIEGREDGFAVEELEPTGQQGTEIVLDAVTTKLREDRILRHLQRLPLSEEFMVWRNGEPIPPRRWYGVQKIDINEVVKWEDSKGQHAETARGEIWIRPEQSKREQAFVAEPKNEKEALRREPAGIEVRVDGDMITREFFGHESHGHKVNRLWGWVDVPWLPIVGNRTDYRRDTPAGHAFYERMREVFAEAFGSIRYVGDRRAESRGKGKGADPSKEGAKSNDAASSAPDESDVTLSALAARYGKTVNQVVEDKPELAPVIEQPAERSRGRPGKDRLYPARPVGKASPFDVSVEGADLAIEEKTDQVSRGVVTGSKLRPEARKAPALELADIVVNTTAGVQLQFAALGPFEAPYRWELDDPAELMLSINTDHKMYLDALGQGRVGNPTHRMYCAWVVALAMAERRLPTSGRALSDYLEALSYELFSGWNPS